MLKEIRLRRLYQIILFIAYFLQANAISAAQINLENTVWKKVAEQAKQLSKQPFQAPQIKLPKVLTELDYDHYRSIRFKPEASIWRGQSPFELQLFHTGYLYPHSVNIHLVSKNSDQALAFSKNFFRYDDIAAPLSESNMEEAGFAGFRLHYPLNTTSYKDEFLVFLGASYFRLIGQHQAYGISARGLSINTSFPIKAPQKETEEFPRFSEFWIIQPQATQKHILIFALLDSPSITGAYQFEVRPGQDTEVRIKAKLFARQDIEQLGVAPLTSMFLKGENTPHRVNDHRPEIHDSDGLAISNGQQWLWRPLNNPHSAQISTFAANQLRGFGLLQRDRNSDHYRDKETFYEKRPSIWITPENDWGEGHVELVELPADAEVVDNIVAYWVPSQKVKQGEVREYQYRIHPFNGSIPTQSVANIVQTSIEHDRNGEARYVIEFDVSAIPKQERKNLLPVFSHPNLVNNVKLHSIEEQTTLQLSFTLQSESSAYPPLRLFLRHNRQCVSEIWTNEQDASRSIKQ